MLGGVDSVASFITVNEQSESNPDCDFHSPIASLASGRSYYQNLFTHTGNLTNVVKTLSEQAHVAYNNGYLLSSFSRINIVFGYLDKVVTVRNNDYTNYPLGF